MENMNQPKNSNTFGIISLILGILGIVLMFAGWIGGVLSLLAIMAALDQKRKNWNGIAKTGLILGIIGIILNILYTFILASIIAGYFV